MGQKQGDSPDSRSGNKSSSPPSEQSSPSDDAKSDPSQRSSDAPSEQSTSSGDAKSDPSQRSSDAPPERSSPSGDAKSDPSQRSSDAPSEQSTPSGDAKSSRPFQSWIPTRVLETMASGIGNLLKLLFLAALVCAVAFFAWKYRDLIQQALAQLWRDLQRLWASLWGGRRTAAHDDVDSSTQPSGPPLPSFASYADPFVSGVAERYTTEQLVRYSFEALEAWGREEGCARDAGQTPLEFAQQIAGRYGDVGPETQVLADLYCRVAYGRERIASPRRDNLRRFWQQLRSASRARQGSTHAATL
jgi:hypothetical protein